MVSAPVTVHQKSPTQPPALESWQTFRTEMDRLFDQFSHGFGIPSLRRLFDVGPFGKDDASFTLGIPAVDISEDEKAYKITAELAGMSEKDIDVSVTSDSIVLKGEKRREHEEKGKNRYLSERSYGAFQRSFYLPEGVARDKIAAEFSNGVLTVTLPKTAEAQSRQKKIEVKAA